MIIDDKLINYIEALSRLRLNDNEKEKTKEDLTKILNYIDKLNELNTENIEEVSHSFNFTNNFRQDIKTESYNRNLMLQNAPQKKEGCFKVPKTVE